MLADQWPKVVKNAGDLLAVLGSLVNIENRDDHEFQYLKVMIVTKFKVGSSQLQTLICVTITHVSTTEKRDSHALRTSQMRDDHAEKK